MRTDLGTPANEVGPSRAIRPPRQPRPASDIEEFLSLWGKVIVGFVMLSLLAVGLNPARVLLLAVAGAPMCALITVLIQAVKKA